MGASTRDLMMIEMTITILFFLFFFLIKIKSFLKCDKCYTQYRFFHNVRLKKFRPKQEYWFDEFPLPHYSYILSCRNFIQCPLQSKSEIITTDVTLLFLWFFWKEKKGIIILDSGTVRYGTDHRRKHMHVRTHKHAQ